MRAFGASHQSRFLCVQAAISCAVFFFAVVAHRIFFHSIIQVLHKPTRAIDFLNSVSLAITIVHERFKHRAAGFKFLGAQNRVYCRLPRRAETEELATGESRRVGLVLVRPAIHVSQVNHCSIRNRKSLGVCLHQLRIFFCSGLRGFPVTFEQSLAEFFIKRRRNRHLDGRVYKMLRLGSASSFANGIAQAASLFITFFNALITGFALFLGACHPQARVDIDLDRLRVALRFQGDLCNTFQSFKSLCITRFAF